MRKIFSLIGAFSLFPFVAHGAQCEKQSLREGKLQIRVEQDCRVDIKPYGMNDRKRNYSFYPNGYLMAFIDTNDYNTNSKSTGSRTFRIFPVKSAKPIIWKNSEGTFEILTAGGIHVALTREGELKSINGGAVKTSALVHMDKLSQQKGGVEIAAAHGIVVDHGWAKGGVAYSRLGEYSRISDAHGHSCMVKNIEMYSANPADSSDPLEKFNTPQKWRAFIISRCKNLSWTDSPFKTSLPITNQEFDDPLEDLIETLENAK